MKEKKLTRAQARVLLRREFADVLNNGNWRWDLFIGGLCSALPVPMRSKWESYWRAINTEDFCTMTRYLQYYATHAEISFLRLLSAHLFIRKTYPGRRRK